MKRLLSAVATLVFAAHALAAGPPRPGAGFAPDPRIEQIAQAYALDAADDAKQKYGVTLDGSDDSIKQVESILATMHAAYLKARPKPPDDVVMSYAKTYGSYIGEVYRRHHGADWGIVTLNGESSPGLRATHGVDFWPWGRVRNRLVNGPEDNVADYYAVLLEQGSQRP